jgi:hypothetical protein
MAEDWDSGRVHDTIAGDFGMVTRDALGQDQTRILSDPSWIPSATGRDSGSAFDEEVADSREQQGDGGQDK